VNSSTTQLGSERQLPPRTLPILYFALAHAALILAFAAVATDARGVSGFFYHARMLAIVHLVTLGWITSSILGALYIVGPVALRTHLSATWLDYTAFAFVLIGVSGMVAHFWIETYGGMAWSAATVALGILSVGARVLRALRRARVAAAVVTHIVLAFINIAGAATMGVLLGFDKVHHFLSGYVLTNVFAHAHLAAIGWASMMVVGVGYRLLPMVLPSAIPEGRSVWISAVLLEIGVVGLFVALLRRSALTAVFAPIIVAGFVAFLAHVAWMLAHARPRPPAIVTPDPAVLHAGAAFASLAVACVFGLVLVFGATSERWLRVATAYGVVGLAGFLGQMIVAMEGRLLPIFAWYWAIAGAGANAGVVSSHEMPWRPGQYVVFGLWAFGVPVLAYGLALDAATWVRLSAWALLAAAVLDTLQTGHILTHAYRQTPPRTR
jgi:hypothetical protein